MTEVFIIWSDLLIHFFIIYYLGWLLLLPFKRREVESHQEYYIKLLLGTLGVIGGYALYYTSFQSIFLILPFCYLFFLWKYRRKSFPSDKANGNVWKYHAISMLVLTALLLIQLFRNDYFNEEIEFFSDVDFPIYATISEYLMQTGLETSSPWYSLASDSKLLKPQPYHFGDLWLGAFCLSSSFELSSIKKYAYILCPLLGALSFWAIKSFFREKNSFFELVLIFLLNISAVYFLANHYLFQGLYCNTYTSTKTFSLFLLLPISIGFIKSKLYSLAAFCIITSSLFNILFLPSLLSGIFFLTIYWLTNKSKKTANFFVWLFPAIFLVTYILLFYLFIGTSFIGLVPTELNLTEYLYRVIRGFASGSFRFILFEIPFMLIVFSLWKNRRLLSSEHKSIIILVFGILTGGLAGKAFFNMQESEIDQVFYMVANPVAIIFVAYFLGLRQNWRQKLRIQLNFYPEIITGLFVLVSFVNLLFFFHQRDTQASKVFVHQIHNALNDKNKLGASISNLENENIYTNDPRMCLFCAPLKAIGNGYWAHDIQIESSLDSLAFPEKRNAISIAPFFQFMQQQKADNTWQTIAYSQIDFINKNAIDFVIIKKGASYSDFLQNCATETIVDSLSGTTVLILQRPCAY